MSTYEKIPPKSDYVRYRGLYISGNLAFFGSVFAGFALLFGLISLTIAPASSKYAVGIPLTVVGGVPMLALLDVVFNEFVDWCKERRVDGKWPIHRPTKEDYNRRR